MAVRTWRWRSAAGAGGARHEKAVLSRCLVGLADGRSPPHNVVLIGPRGNGKTALLIWFQRTCRESAASPDVVAIAAADLPNQAALRTRLVPSVFTRFLPRKIAVASLGSAEWATSDATDSLTRRLIARCRRRPLAVLLDEAHTLNKDVGRLLLNASQQVRAEAPFLLVLAGTPGLAAHLGKMDASFWDRLGSGLLGIGRLTADATKEALEEPLAGQGASIDDDALEMVVEHSQCYAYFVQLWGEALWNQRLATGEPQLTAAHAKAAAPSVAAQVTDYYQRRYRELEADGLLPSAVAVASAFGAGGDGRASDGDIDEALAAGGIKAPRRLDVREELNRLGYIWCPPGQLPPVVWSAGIPSLMQYVLNQVAQTAAGS